MEWGPHLYEPVIILAPNPADLELDIGGKPVLTFDDTRGWMLAYYTTGGAEQLSASTDEHEIGLPLDAVDYACDQARLFLRWYYSAEQWVED